MSTKSSYIWISIVPKSELVIAILPYIYSSANIITSVVLNPDPSKDWNFNESAALEPSTGENTLSGWIIVLSSAIIKFLINPSPKRVAPLYNKPLSSIDPCNSWFPCFKSVEPTLPCIMALLGTNKFPLIIRIPGEIIDAILASRVITPLFAVSSNDSLNIITNGKLVVKYSWLDNV